MATPSNDNDTGGRSRSRSRRSGSKPSPSPLPVPPPKRRRKTSVAMVPNPTATATATATSTATSKLSAAVTKKGGPFLCKGCGRSFVTGQHMGGHVRGCTLYHKYLKNQRLSSSSTTSTEI